MTNKNLVWKLTCHIMFRNVAGVHHKMSQKELDGKSTQILLTIFLGVIDTEISNILYARSNGWQNKIILCIFFILGKRNKVVKMKCSLRNLVRNFDLGNVNLSLPWSAIIYFLYPFPSTIVYFKTWMIKIDQTCLCGS